MPHYLVYQLQGELRASWNQLKKMIDNNQDRKFEKVEKLLMKLTPEKEEISSMELEDAWRDLRRSKSKLPVGRKFSRSTYWIAATLGILTLSVLSFGRWYSGVEHNGALSEVLIKSTQPGQKSRFRLPDGSSVILNSASTLMFSKDFLKANQRKVHLEGEALFDIKHNEKRPFVVVTDELETQVLGTQFNVSAYPDDEHISVSLIKGSVEVYGGSKSVKLIPGFQATKKIGETEIQTNSFDKDQIEWSDGTLFLEHVDFHQFIEKLERWYGVQIEVAPGVISSEWNFHGKFKNKPLYYVLEAASYPDQFEYKIESKKVEIYESGHEQQ